MPLEESLGALQRLQAEGKIRHIGVSNVSVAQLRKARQQVAVVSVQNRYNLFDRSSEDVLEECEREGLAFIPWYPLAAGRGPTSDDGRSALSALARRLGATPMQVATGRLAGPLAHDAADPRHGLDRTSGGERGGGPPEAVGGRPPRARLNAHPPYRRKTAASSRWGDHRNWSTGMIHSRR